MEHFLKTFGFISCIHPVKKTIESIWKEQNSEGDCTELSVYDLQADQSGLLLQTDNGLGLPFGGGDMEMSSICWLAVMCQCV